MFDVEGVVWGSRRWCNWRNKPGPNPQRGIGGEALQGRIGMGLEEGGCGGKDGERASFTYDRSIKS